MNRIFIMENEMENKSYKIQGKTLTQGEMTLGQTKRLIALTATLAGEDVTRIRDVKTLCPG